jgi:hypothetical protein
VGSLPRAVCPHPTYNWGKVFSGEEVTHTYVIRNEGTADLRIVRVQETCRCTKKDYTEVIRPGEAGRVSLAIDTRGFKGKIEKHATITTNDPQNPKIVLRFGGEARPFATVSPLYPVLRSIVGGEPATTTVTVKPASELPIESLKCVSKSSRINVQVERIDKTGSYRVRLETVRGIAIANVQEQISLEATAGSKNVLVQIRAHISLRRRVQILPPWVIFRFTETDNWEKDPTLVPTRTLTIKAAEGVTFSVTTMNCVGDFFAAELTETKPQREYTLIVKLTRRPEGPTQPARGQLEIHTSDPIDKTLKVRVTAFFKSPANPPRRTPARPTFPSGGAKKPTAVPLPHRTQ